MPVRIGSSSLFLLTSLLVGCGGDDSPNCEETLPVSENATVHFSEVRFEYCRFLERCSPGSLDQYHGGTVDSCIAYERCTNGAGDDWTVTNECLTAMRALPCGGDREVLDAIGLMHQSSTCELGGPIPFAKVGEACRQNICREGELPASHVRCDENSFCGRNDVCVAYVAMGASCSISEEPGVSYDPCEPASYCDFALGSCAASLALGDACQEQTSPGGTVTVDPCDDYTYCAAGRCASTVGPDTPKPGLGASCISGEQSCQNGLACVANTCVEWTCEGGVGTACEAGSCASPLRCDRDTELCEERRRCKKDSDCEWDEICGNDDYCSY